MRKKRQISNQFYSYIFKKWFFHGTMVSLHPKKTMVVPMRIHAGTQLGNRTIPYTLWLFNIAMEMVDFPS
jgi:hypothetical protein